MYHAAAGPGGGSSYYAPCFITAPPPPPPPRSRVKAPAASTAGDTTDASSVDDCSRLPAPAPLRPQQQQQQQSRADEACAGSTGRLLPQQQQQQHGGSGGLSSCSSADVEQQAALGRACPGCRDALAQVELRLRAEVARVEADAQASHKQLAHDLSKVKKEREAAWRHVGELKDQSHQMRQRTFELEVQNGHLHRTVVLLQEQLEVMKEQQQQDNHHSHGLARMAAEHHTAALRHPLGALQINSMPHGGAGGPGCNPPLSPLAMAALEHKMPKVPHTGAEIW